MTDRMELLKPEDFGLGAKPAIDRIECQQIVDHLGDPALDVLVVLADSNREEEIGFEALQAVQSAIFDRLNEQYHGERFAYIRFQIARELEELAKQMAEDDAAEEAESEE